MKFLAFAASHRPESLNYKLLLVAAEYVRNLGAQVEIVNYNELDMPVYNDTLTDNPPDSTKKLVKRCHGKNGIIIATPEYNWSFPGSLKNIIDWTSVIDKNALAGKSAFLMSAVTGSRGGIVGLQQLKSPLEALDMHIFHKVFPLAKAQDAFNENGELLEKKQEELLFKLIKDYTILTKKISTI